VRGQSSATSAWAARFLGAVGATVPRRASIVVFVPRGGNPRATNPLYPRALYRLYPRQVERVLTAPSDRTAHGWLAPALPWDLVRIF
jgi:hypothetical protein